jgi:hypothetical protein
LKAALSPVLLTAHGNYALKARNGAISHLSIKSLGNGGVGNEADMPEGPIPHRSCLIDTAMHICILTRPGRGFSVNHVYSSLLGPSLKVPRSSEGRIRAQSFLLCFILYRSCMAHHVLSRDTRLSSATPEPRYIHHLRSVFNPSPRPHGHSKEQTYAA